MSVMNFLKEMWKERREHKKKPRENTFTPMRFDYTNFDSGMPNRTNNEIERIIPSIVDRVSEQKSVVHDHRAKNYDGSQSTFSSYSSSSSYDSGCSSSSDSGGSCGGGGD